MIRNVIFDIGDVLVKTNVRETIASHGYDAAMADRIMQRPMSRCFGKSWTAESGSIPM